MNNEGRVKQTYIDFNHKSGMEVKIEMTKQDEEYNRILGMVQEIIEQHKVSKKNIYCATKTRTERLKIMVGELLTQVGCLFDDYNCDE